jgi:hypothetical protein
MFYQLWFAIKKAIEEVTSACYTYMKRRLRMLFLVIKTDDIISS